MLVVAFSLICLMACMIMVYTGLATLVLYIFKLSFILAYVSFLARLNRLLVIAHWQIFDQCIYLFIDVLINFGSVS